MTLGTVLVTGGTGSFGRVWIAHLLKEGLADRVISFSRNASLRYQLRQDIPDARLTVWAGDVSDLNDFDGLPHVDTIVHAAAEKHIDTAEARPYWVVKTNVWGSEQVIRFARARGIAPSRVVALSTDKACNPCNVYGRTKSTAESTFQHAGYIGVRYGNVIGSSGSVVPLFLAQRQRGRLTVTDRRMTRYFMPLSDDSPFNVRQHHGAKVMSAVGLVQYALEHGAGGEIFIPEIPSGSIQGLAEAISPDTAIEEIGIRPGEKLHEELIHPSEADRCWRTDDGVYVLLPSPSSVPSMPAVRVAPGFSYASNHQPSEILEVQVCGSV